MMTSAAPARRWMGRAFDDVRRVEHLPALLSVIAGTVDVIGYLTLGGLFTAHVTGNIVLIAAVLVRGGSPTAPQVLALPVFIVAVAAVWLVARVSAMSGLALLRLLLVVQFLLLAGVLALTVFFNIDANPAGLMTSVAAIIATSAMACQFTLLRLAVRGAPSTAVMTGNLTNTVLSSLEMVWPGEPLLPADRARLRTTAALLVGFLAGCLAAAAAVTLLKDWSWLLPVALAGAAVALVSGSFTKLDEYREGT
jgi:uncharacterized membrane protein YoaK (UPF0700 family)